MKFRTRNASPDQCEDGFALPHFRQSAANSPTIRLNEQVTSRPPSMGNAAFPSLPLDRPVTFPLPPNHAPSAEVLFEADIANDLAKDTVERPVIIDILSRSGPCPVRSSSITNESPVIPVQWSTLQVSLQCHILNNLLYQGKSPHQMPDVLKVSAEELEETFWAINLRKVHPASTDEIWNYCAARSGYGGNAIDPAILNQFIDYMNFAEKYEYCTAEGISKARQFLHQLNLDIEIDACDEDGYIQEDQIMIDASEVHNSSVLTDLVDAHQESNRVIYDRDTTLSASPQTITEWRNFVPYATSHETNAICQSQPKITRSIDISTISRSSHPSVSLTANSDRLCKRRRVDDRLDLESRTSTKESGLSDGNRVYADGAVGQQQIGNHHGHCNMLSSDVGNDNSKYSSAMFPNDRNLNLVVNETTGIATVVDSFIQRCQPFVHDGQRFLHTDQDPASLAAHFSIRSFPPRERYRLLAMDPASMTNADRWLVYICRSPHDKSLADCNIGRNPLAGLQAPFVREILPDRQSIIRFARRRSRQLYTSSQMSILRQLGLQAILETYDQSSRYQEWTADKGVAELKHYLECVCGATVESVWRLSAIDRGLIEGYAHASTDCRQQWIATSPDQLWYPLRIEAMICHNQAIKRSYARLSKSLTYNVAPIDYGKALNNKTSNTGEESGSELVQNKITKPATPPASTSTFDRNHNARLDQVSRIFQAKAGLPATQAHIELLRKDCQHDGLMGTESNLLSDIPHTSPDNPGILNRSPSQLTELDLAGNKELFLSPTRPEFSPISDYGSNTPWDLSSQVCRADDSSTSSLSGQATGPEHSASTAIKYLNAIKTHTNANTIAGVCETDQIPHGVGVANLCCSPKNSAILGACNGGNQLHIPAENSVERSAHNDAASTEQNIFDPFQYIRSFSFSTTESKGPPQTCKNTPTKPSPSETQPNLTQHSIPAINAASLNRSANLIDHQARKDTQTGNSISDSAGSIVAVPKSSGLVNKPSPPKTVRKDAGMKRGPYKKTREKMAREAGEKARVIAAKALELIADDNLMVDSDELVSATPEVAIESEERQVTVAVQPTQPRKRRRLE